MNNTIGIRKSHEALQLGLVFSPQEALSMGLVDELCQAEELMNRVNHKVEQWLAIPGRHFNNRWIFETEIIIIDRVLWYFKWSKSTLHGTKLKCASWPSVFFRWATSNDQVHSASRSRQEIPCWKGPRCGRFRGSDLQRRDPGGLGTDAGQNRT